MDGFDTDQVVLQDLGADLRQERLSRDLSQAALAREAGVTRDTIRRLEAGEPVSTLTLIRTLRALGLVRGLANLVPGQGPGPLEQLDRGPVGRQRASGTRKQPGPAREWRWDDGDQR